LVRFYSGVPKRNVLLTLIIEVLSDVSKPISSRQIDELVAKELKLDEKTLKEPHSGKRTRFQYEMAWARSEGRKKGLLLKSDSGWSVVSGMIAK